MHALGQNHGDRERLMEENSPSVEPSIADPNDWDVDGDEGRVDGSGEHRSPLVLVSHLDLEWTGKGQLGVYRNEKCTYSDFDSNI